MSARTIASPIRDVLETFQRATTARHREFWSGGDAVLTWPHFKVTISLQGDSMVEIGNTARLFLLFDEKDEAAKIVADLGAGKHITSAVCNRYDSHARAARLLALDDAAWRV